MKRSRNDDQGYRRGAKGIDDDLGGDYTKADNSYAGTYYQGRNPPIRGGSEGGHGFEHSQPGAYTDNDSGLTNVEDFQFSAGVRDIMDLVEQNQRPRGDDNFGFDATGPVKFGVNRSQSEGNKDPYRAKKP